MNNKLTIIVGFTDGSSLPHPSQVVDLNYHCLTPKKSVEAYTEYVEDVLANNDTVVLTNSTDFVNTIRYLVYQHKIDYQSVIIQYQEEATSEKHIVYLDGNGRFVSEDGEHKHFPVKLVLDKLETEHHLVAHKFYCGFGAELQYAGSLIIDYVTDYMMQTHKCLVLSVFDECIAKEEFRDELYNAMVEAYESVLGFSDNAKITVEK